MRELCEGTETARNNEMQNEKQIENEWGEKQEVRMRNRMNGGRSRELE
jgi:hypothetical protein